MGVLDGDRPPDELGGGIGDGIELLRGARPWALLAQGAVDQAAQEPDHVRPRGVLGQRDEGHAVVPGGGADLGQVGHPRPEQDGGDAAPPGCRHQLGAVDRRVDPHPDREVAGYAEHVAPRLGEGQVVDGRVLGRHDELEQPREGSGQGRRGRSRASA